VNVLERVKKTESQMKLDREERRKNMRGAFELLRSVSPKGTVPVSTGAAKDAKVQSFKEKNSDSMTLCNSVTQVILVDDIITSGTTMLEAANVLKRNGVEKVWGIALAHGK
jgi:predicted amidophosphoribosyltransferase